jgi:hypothetical protein
MPLKSLALTSSSVRVGMTAESTCHSLFSSGRSEITGRALSLGKHNTRAHCNSGLFPGIGAITARILGNGVQVLEQEQRRMKKNRRAHLLQPLI